MIIFKAKAQAEKLEQELEEKDKEAYNLKHDLISNQIKAESDAKELKKLEKENRELLLNKARLEASLEDSLLGKVKSKPGHGQAKQEQGEGKAKAPATKKDTTEEVL